MAHKGKIYPIKQNWRIYAGEITTTYGLPPERMTFRTQFLVGSLGTFPDFELRICDAVEPATWGDPIHYRSADFAALGHTVAVGMCGEVRSDGSTWWRYSVWVDDVDQIPWGWQDFPDHVAWHPGQTRIIFDPPSPAVLLSPNGLTDVQGKHWT